jgi:hypothetical protein
MSQKQPKHHAERLNLTSKTVPERKGMGEIPKPERPRRIHLHRSRRTPRSFPMGQNRRKRAVQKQAAKSSTNQRGTCRCPHLLPRHGKHAEHRPDCCGSGKDGKQQEKIPSGTVQGKSQLRHVTTRTPHRKQPQAALDKISKLPKVDSCKTGFLPSQIAFKSHPRPAHPMPKPTDEFNLYIRGLERYRASVCRTNTFRPSDKTTKPFLSSKARF